MFRHSWRQILLYTSITVIVNIFFYFFYIFRFNSNLGFRSPSTVYYNNKFRFYSCFLLISKKIIRRPRGHRFPALTNSRFFATFVNLSLKIQQKTTEIRIFFDKIDKFQLSCQFCQRRRGCGRLLDRLNARKQLPAADRNSLNQATSRRLAHKPAAYP